MEEILYTMTEDELFDLMVDMYVDEWAEEAGWNV